MSDPTPPEESIAEIETPGRELVLELNFVPAWARQPPGATSFFRDRPERAGPSRDRQGDRSGDRRPERAGARPARREGAPAPRDPRHPDRDRPSGARTAARYAQAPAPVREPPLPLHVRFFPEERQLSAVVKRIRATKRAYPLMQIVGLFLANPRACRVKMESDSADLRLFQCTTCGMVALTRQALDNHLLRDHLADAFAVEEIESAPPTGNFVCVARCRLSGTLLGPPNHNSYAEKVDEVYRSGYTHLTPTEFRRSIETLHDAALIEEWKAASCKQTLYRRKDAPADAPALKRPAAAEAFLKEFAPAMVKSAAQVSLPAELAHRSGDPRLSQALDAAWNRECRSPRSLPLAILGALRGRHLHLFRAGAGERFVTFVDPVPLDPARTIDSIREVLTFLRQKPGCTRAQLLADLRPDATVDSPEAAAILSPFAWLIERGHIIEFHDGTLAVPLGR